MKRIVVIVIGAVALVAAAGAGVWAGQKGLVRVTGLTTGSVEIPTTQAAGAVIYYRDPDGRPFYSAAPKKSDSGADYLPVHANEDTTFDAPQKSVGAKQGGTIKFYRNPMGLPDTSPVPKKDAMGMDYIPVFEGEDSDDDAVKVSPGKVQRTGVETVKVAKRDIVRTIKAPGVVQLDETRVNVLAPRFDGFIVKLGAATTGTHVKKGDVLATVFGQELLNWGARLIIEKGYNYKGADEAFTPPGLKSEGSGVIGARRRLENFGAPESFINEIIETRKVPNAISLVAPMDGVVLERNVVEGQAFKAGDVLFRTADHSNVWMMADVAEGDIDALKAGQAVTVTTRARPGRTFKGKVAVIYPHLMKETRTARVRVELANPDLALLPDMYGDVEIATGTKDEVVAVPNSAVIDSGSRQVVIVSQGEGRYEPRNVELGRKGDGYVEVREGLQGDETVVVNGNFLIDAESNLQAALKGLSEPSSTEPAP